LVNTIPIVILSIDYILNLGIHEKIYDEILATVKLSRTKNCY
jgi:hypothetical protein